MTILSEDEFKAIMSDESKKITKDITWEAKNKSSTKFKFRIKIDSHNGYPIEIDGRYNIITSKLNYAIVHKGISRRIYALDMGQDHANPPDGTLVGTNHIHRWTDKYEDRKAISAEGIISHDSSNPTKVWKEFCNEAKINFQGTMNNIPIRQTKFDPDLEMIL